MITFIAFFRVPPENAAAFEELLRYVVTMSNTEPGVVYYGFARSVDAADTYSVVEVYQDQDAVARTASPTGSPDRCRSSLT